MPGKSKIVINAKYFNIHEESHVVRQGNRPFGTQGNGPLLRLLSICYVLNTNDLIYPMVGNSEEPQCSPLCLGIFGFIVEGDTSLSRDERIKHHGNRTTRAVCTCCLQVLPHHRNRGCSGKAYAQ